MGKFLAFMSKNIQSKGKTKNNLINYEKIKTYFFDEDYENLSLLDTLTLNLDHEDPTLLYPGCGSDILFPLHYIEKLFPSIKNFNFIFIDEEENLEIIKTILDDVGITFSQKENTLQFYWKDKHINLEFKHANIFPLLNNLPRFHIYFERAFRIMKGQVDHYENKIVEKLVSGGLIISDSGFMQFPLQRINVPLKLSSYNEMIIGMKI